MAEDGVMLAPPPRPPVVHEVFTLLPCPKQQVSTLDIEGCAEHTIVRLDEKIDGEARTIFRVLRSTDARRSFVAGERAWAAYRLQSCRAEASKYEGGTAAGIVDAQCQADRSRVHLTELAGLLKTLRTP